MCCWESSVSITSASTFFRSWAIYGVTTGCLILWDIVYLTSAAAEYLFLLVSSLLLLLLLLSCKTSKTYISAMPWSISTKLVHLNPWSCPNLSYNQLGVKGHVGVIGFKKVISLKTVLLLQITGYGHVIHVHASAWPLYKSYGFRNLPGVIWSHRGQKVIFTKKATSTD